MHNESTSLIFPFAAQRHRGVTVTEAKPAELWSRSRGHDLWLSVRCTPQMVPGWTWMSCVPRRRRRGLGCLSMSVRAPGGQPLRLHWAQFVVGAGYKWLLAPRGAAWMAVRPRYARRCCSARCELVWGRRYLIWPGWSAASPGRRRASTRFVSWVVLATRCRGLAADPPRRNPRRGVPHADGNYPYRLAKEIRVSQTRVGEILAGKRGITADTGLRLSRALGRSDMFWINLQARYDADLVRIEKSEASAARRCVLSQWIRQTRSQCRSQPLRRGSFTRGGVGCPAPRRRLEQPPTEVV